MTRITLLASLALFAALSAPALCGLVYTADDLGAFHLPLRDFYARALANGDSFDWCPHLFGGFYLTGEGQAGTYHPLHWLLYRFMPLSWAWNIECLASYPLLFVGVWLFLRRRGLSQAQSLFAAMTFTFCGFNLLHFVHVNAIAVIAHVPWLLYAVDRLNDTVRWRVHGSLLSNTRGPRGLRQAQPALSASKGGLGPPYTVALIGGLTASQLLLGYPQYVMYSLVAEGLFLACVLCERPNGGVRGTIQVVSLWTLAKLLGLALGAVQVLPTLEALADSARQNADASFAAWGSLHPLNAVQLIAPYLSATRVLGQNTHELTFYMGAAPLLLAAIAVVNRRTLADAACIRMLVRLAGILVVVGGLLSLGAYGLLHRVLSEAPLISSFRFPCRATVLIQFGIALLAAIGFSAICGAASSHEQPIRIPYKSFAALLLLSAGLASGATALWPEFMAVPQLVWCGPLLLLFASVLICLAAKRIRWAAAGLVVFTALDLGVYGLSYGAYREATTLENYIAQTPAPATCDGGRVALDLALPHSEGPRSGNQIVLRGFSRIDGYAGLEPARQLDYRTLDALRLAGVKAVAGSAPVEDKLRLPKSDDGWLEVPDALPRARLVQPYFDEAQSVPNVAGAARITYDGPGQIVVDVDCPAPAFLVLSESFHRGWRASTDGTALKTLRVNGDFLGCLVAAGRSTVEFRFAPASLRHGRIVSVCGLGFLGLMLVIGRFSRLGTPIKR